MGITAILCNHKTSWFADIFGKFRPLVDITSVVVPFISWRYWSKKNEKINELKKFESLLGKNNKFEAYEIILRLEHSKKQTEEKTKEAFPNQDQKPSIQPGLGFGLKKLSKPKKKPKQTFHNQDSVEKLSLQPRLGWAQRTEQPNDISKTSKDQEQQKPNLVQSKPKTKDPQELLSQLCGATDNFPTTSYEDAEKFRKTWLKKQEEFLQNSVCTNWSMKDFLDNCCFLIADFRGLIPYKDQGINSLDIQLCSNKVVFLQGKDNWYYPIVDGFVNIQSGIRDSNTPSDINDSDEEDESSSIIFQIDFWKTKFEKTKNNRVYKSNWDIINKFINELDVNKSFDERFKLSFKNIHEKIKKIGEDIEKHINQNTPVIKHKAELTEWAIIANQLKELIKNENNNEAIEFIKLICAGWDDVFEQFLQCVKNILEKKSDEKINELRTFLDKFTYNELGLKDSSQKACNPLQALQDCVNGLIAIFTEQPKRLHNVVLNDTLEEEFGDGLHNLFKEEN